MSGLRVVGASKQHSVVHVIPVGSTVSGTVREGACEPWARARLGLTPQPVGQPMRRDGCPVCLLVCFHLQHSSQSALSFSCLLLFLAFSLRLLAFVPHHLFLGFSLLFPSLTSNKKHSLKEKTKLLFPFLSSSADSFCPHEPLNFTLKTPCLETGACLVYLIPSPNS